MGVSTKVADRISSQLRKYQLIGAFVADFYAQGKSCIQDLPSGKQVCAKIKNVLSHGFLARVRADGILVTYVSFCARLVLRMQKPFIVGITGSVGKTTTTEMISAVLRQREAEARIGRVGKTAKNMNDDIGLPLAVLLFDDWMKGGRYQWVAKLCLLPFRAAVLAFTPQYPRVLVLEYGTHWKGHLHRLAELAPPNIAVVTTIGPAHLERLKTLEGIVHEKSAIVRAVGSDGLVVLGDDHDFVSHFERLSLAPVTKVTGRGAELSRNIARIIGRHFGIAEAAISVALEQFKPPPRRLNRIEIEGLTIIDDTYNANPLSMRLGLDTLAGSVEPGRRRVAILGGMGELGDDSLKYHEETGIYARSCADLLIGVGDLGRHYLPDHWFVDSGACANEVGSLLRTGDCVFVKGSASVRMAKVVAELQKQDTALPR
jgi:UDP-N-acetylmuramoyl-tripeptide--D-alanyl-D-alanine ligase